MRKKTCPSFFLGGRVCTLSSSAEHCCTLRLSLGPFFWLSLGLFPLDHLLSRDPAGQLATPVQWNSASRVASKWENSTGEKAWRLRTTWQGRFKHKSEREESEGEKRSPPTLFLLFTDFYYYFGWLKILSLFFLTFGLKQIPPFLANDGGLFRHIMLALGYYHSMMLRGDQSLYEFITIAQRLLVLLADTIIIMHACLIVVLLYDVYFYSITAYSITYSVVYFLLIITSILSVFSRLLLSCAFAVLLVTR